MPMPDEVTDLTPVFINFARPDGISVDGYVEFKVGGIFPVGGDDTFPDGSLEETAFIVGGPDGGYSIVAKINNSRVETELLPSRATARFTYTVTMHLVVTTPALDDGQPDEIKRWTVPSFEIELLESDKPVDIGRLVPVQQLVPTTPSFTVELANQLFVRNSRLGLPAAVSSTAGTGTGDPSTTIVEPGIATLDVDGRVPVEQLLPTATWPAQYAISYDSNRGDLVPLRVDTGMRGYTAAVPTEDGELGDFFKNSNPQPGGVERWVCIEPGTNAAGEDPAVWWPAYLGGGGEGAGGLGLAKVATTGAYGDLVGPPRIPTQPSDVGAVSVGRKVGTGAGLLGGGTLEADRTLSLDFGTSNTQVRRGDDEAFTNARTPTSHTHTSTQISDWVKAVREAPVAIRTVTSATTITADDEVVRVNSSSPVTVTYPASSGTNPPGVGRVLVISQIGTGQVTVAGSGITFRGNVKTAAQNADITVLKTAANEVDVRGGIA